MHGSIELGNTTRQEGERRGEERGDQKPLHPLDEEGFLLLVSVKKRNSEIMVAL